jgi:hypothetical protein
MTFRPSQKSRWGWALAVASAAVATWCMLWIAMQPRHHGLRTVEVVLGSFVLLGGLIWYSFQTWSSRVIVDDRGVHWKGGGEPANSMSWNQIGRLGYERKDLMYFVGVVELASGKFYRLPFMSQTLYAALKERLNPLPDDVEEELFPALGK